MKVLIIILLLNFCSAQASGVSVFGLGDRLGNIDAASQGLGKSNFFTGNLNGISFSSPSSIWKTNLTCFNVNSGMNFLDIPMSTPLRQKIGLSFCVDRGTTIGENTLARKASFLFSEEFMKNVRWNASGLVMNSLNQTEISKFLSDCDTA